MSTISITFRGLCTFVENKTGKVYDVCLPNVRGHGHPEHLPSLAVNIESIDTDPAATSWLPDAVVYDKTGGTAGQMGIWKLNRRTVILKPSISGPGDLPQWADRKDAIDFRQHHSTAEAKSKSR